ncbi:MAG: hypothetical protein K2M06_08430 [Muribaculaceae bacterium]|nr:hypothetical protein [Muribaculaceae bacterium]
MKQVVRHIEYLLRSGDNCVVIPGVGALLARRVSARFDASAGRFIPPTVSYAFNGAIKQSDGMLAASVARRLDIPFEQAARTVEDFALSVRAQLRDGAVVSLGRVGSLIRRPAGAVEFMPGINQALPSSASWLEPLALRPLIASHSGAFEADEYSDADDEARVLASVVSNAWRRTAVRAGRIAASVAIVLAMGLVVAMLLGRTAPATQQASLGFDFTTTTSSSTSSAGRSSAIITRPGESSSPLVLVLRNFDDAATVVDTTKAVQTWPRELSAHSPSAAYFFVVASLASREEAERYVRKNGGDLRILPVDGGRFRVYAASGPTSGSVREKAGALGLDKTYPEAWVCRAR